jgi:DNA-binding NtrC family response regulator
VASVRGKIITEDQVAIQSEVKPVPQSTHAMPITGKSLFEAVDALERRMIQDALNQVGGNKLKAAQMLGMSRGGFLKKLKKLTLAAEV